MFNVLNDSDLEAIVGGRGSSNSLNDVSGNGNFNSRSTFVGTAASLSQGNAITGNATVSQGRIEMENRGLAIAVNVNLDDSPITVLPVKG